MNATVPQPETSKKFYSLDEANRALPLVKAIVGDIVNLYGQIRDRRDRLAAITGPDSSHSRRDDIYSEEVAEMESSVYQDIERLQEYVSELDQLGIDLKDPQTGAINFSGLLEGREISLCWKQGENQITHWHEVDSGEEEHQSLELLK